MYLYFNKQGKLIGQRESLPIRVGSKNANIIYAFFENTNFTGLATIKFKFSDGSITNEMAMFPCEEGEFVLSGANFENGQNTIINPFQYGIDYSLNGYTQKFIVQNINLVAGLTNATIRLYKANEINKESEIFSQGNIVFTIEENLYDFSVEEEDGYNILLNLLANKIDWGTTFGTFGINKNILTNEIPTIMDYLDIRYDYEFSHDYTYFTNKPQINGVELKENKKSAELNLLDSRKSEYQEINNLDLLSSGSSLVVINDSGELNTISTNKLVSHVQTKDEFSNDDEINTYIFSEKG